MKKIAFIVSMLVAFNCSGVYAQSTASSSHGKAQDYVPFQFPDIPNSAQQPLVLGPAGETFKFLQTGKENCGKYLFAKLIVPPHVGPPPHVHHWTDEWFYAPEGGFEMMMGETPYPNLHQIPGENAPKDVLHLMPMRPKELFYGARFFIHAFVNTSDTPKELYLVWTPDTPEASILPYFLTAGTAVKDSDLNRQPDFLSRIRLVSYAPKFGINQSADFWQYVKDVKESKPEHMHDDHHQELLSLVAQAAQGCRH